MDASNEAEYTLMLEDISDESYVDQTVTDAPEFMLMCQEMSAVQHKLNEIKDNLQSVTEPPQHGIDPELLQTLISELQNAVQPRLSAERLSALVKPLTVDRGTQHFQLLSDSECQATVSVV